VIVGTPPAYAADELDINYLRNELQGRAAQAGQRGGFEVLEEDGESAQQAARKLREQEEKLLRQIGSTDQTAAPQMLEGGVTTNEERHAPHVVETRFLDDARPVNAEPAMENPADVVAARIAKQDAVAAIPEVADEPVIAPKPSRAARDAEGAKSSGTMAAVKRAAMSDEGTGDDGSYAELQDLIKRHGAIKAELKQKTDAVAKLKKKNEDLSEGLSKAESRAKSLEQELTEARNRLIIAETEVERLSGLMLTTVRSSKSLGRLDSGALEGATTPPRAAPPPMPRRPAAPQPAEDMPVATVVVDKANLRTGPGSEHSPLMSVTQGTRLLVELRRGEWYRVISPNGTRAWVSADVVAFGASSQASPSRTVKVKAFDPSLEN
jgi:hypothetical protein